MLQLEATVLTSNANLVLELDSPFRCGMLLAELGSSELLYRVNFPVGIGKR